MTYTLKIMSKFIVFLLAIFSSFVVNADRYGISEEIEGGSGLSNFGVFILIVFFIYLHFKDKK